MKCEKEEIGSRENKKSGMRWDVVERKMLNNNLHNVKEDWKVFFPSRVPKISKSI